MCRLHSHDIFCRVSLPHVSRLVAIVRLLRSVALAIVQYLSWSFSPTKSFSSLSSSLSLVALLAVPISSMLRSPPVLLRASNLLSLTGVSSRCCEAHCTLLCESYWQLVLCVLSTAWVLCVYYVVEFVCLLTLVQLAIGSVLGMTRSTFIPISAGAASAARCTRCCANLSTSLTWSAATRSLCGLQQPPSGCCMLLSFSLDPSFCFQLFGRVPAS